MVINHLLTGMILQVSLDIQTPPEKMFGPPKSTQNTSSGCVWISRVSYKSKQRTTVAGRTPAPPGLNYQPQLVNAGFLPSTVSQGKNPS